MVALYGKKKGKKELKTSFFKRVRWGRSTNPTTLTIYKELRAIEGTT